MSKELVLLKEFVKRLEQGSLSSREKRNRILVAISILREDPNTRQHLKTRQGL